MKEPSYLELDSFLPLSWLWVPGKRGTWEPFSDTRMFSLYDRYHTVVNTRKTTTVRFPRVYKLVVTVRRMVCVPRHKLYTLSTDRGSGDWCSRTRWLKPLDGGRKVAILLFHGKRATFYCLLGAAPTQTGLLTESSTKIEGLPSLSVYQRVWFPRKRRRSVLRFLLCIATQ